MESAVEHNGVCVYYKKFLVEIRVLLIFIAMTSFYMTGTHGKCNKNNAVMPKGCTTTDLTNTGNEGGIGRDEGSFSVEFCFEDGGFITVNRHRNRRNLVKKILKSQELEVVEEEDVPFCAGAKKIKHRRDVNRFKRMEEKKREKKRLKSRRKGRHLDPEGKDILAEEYEERMGVPSEEEQHSRLMKENSEAAAEALRHRAFHRAYARENSPPRSVSVKPYKLADFERQFGNKALLARLRAEEKEAARWQELEKQDRANARWGHWFSRGTTKHFDGIPYSKLDAAARKEYINVRTRILNAASKWIPQDMLDKIDLTHSFIQAVTLVTSLTFCNSKEEVMRVVLPFLTAKFTPSDMQEAIVWLSERLQPPVEPEGMDFSFAQAFTRIESASIQIAESALGKFLSSVFSLLMFAGLDVSSKFPDCKLTEYLIHMESVHRITAKFTVFECIFSVTEYACEFLDCLIRGDSLVDFFFPSSLLEDVISILNEGSGVERGDIHKQGSEYVKSFSNRLEAIIAKVEIMVRKTKRNLATHTGYAMYYAKLLKVRDDLSCFVRNSGSRVMPKCYVFTGASQIGKSAVTRNTWMMLGAAIGKQYSPEEVANMPPNDKYDTCITNATRVIIMDEISPMKNDGKSGDKTSPLDRMLTIVNNVPAQTNQARAEDKGKVHYTPDFVCGTSNRPDLGMFETYVHPSAIINRVTFVEVFVKPQYQQVLVDAFGNATSINKLDVEKAIAATVEGVSPPLHDVQVYTFVSDSNAKEHATPARKDIGPRMCYHEWLRLEIPVVQRYFQNQQKHIANQWALNDAKMCETCFVHKTWCTCAKDRTVTEEAGFVIPPAVLRPLEDFAMRLAGNDVVARHFDPQSSPIGGTVIAQKIGLAAYAMNKALEEYSQMCMKAYLSIFEFLATVGYVCGASICVFYWTFFISLILIVHFSHVSPIITMSCVSCVAFTAWRALVAYGRNCQRYYAYAALESFAANTVPAFMKVTAFAGVIAALRVVYTAYSNLSAFKAQGAVNSVQVPTAREIEERRISKDDWKAKNFQPLSVPHNVRTMTPNQVSHVAEKNLFTVSFSSKNGLKKKSNGFALCDNIFVVPRHIWKEMDDPNCGIILRKPGVKLQAKILSAKIPNDELCDVVFLQLANTPSFSNLSKFLTNEEYEGPIAFIGRGDDDMLLTASGYTSKALITTRNGTEGILPPRGLEYKIPGGTKPGMCCSLIMAVEGPPRIVGIHSAGNGEISAATFFHKKWFEEFKINVQTQNVLSPEGNEFLPFAEGDELDLAPFGELSFEESEIDFRHCVTHYPDAIDHGVLMLGYDPHLRSKGFTQLRTSLLSEPLLTLGVERTHGVPILRSDRDHAAALDFKMHTILPFDTSLVREAIDDYANPLVSAILEQKKQGLYSGTVLTLDEALNGIPNNKFFNQVDETKAAGFGMKGKKAALLDVMYDELDGHKILKAKPLLVERIDLLMSRVRNGIRMNGVIKTSIKDEPVKVDAEGKPTKPNRVFFGAGIAEFLVMKMILARISEAVMLNCFISECMGSMNHTTKEWESIQQHIFSFGGKYVIEGDYSKWDTRLSSQLIRSVGVVVIRIAMALGYDEGYIAAISAIYSEIAVSVVAYNGALCLIDGWMASGVFPTLLTNSIANSLVYRIAFFTSYPGYDFRAHVRLATLGDDSLAGVKDGIFNAFDIESALASVGMVFTSGDKKCVSIPFIDPSTMSFCKRTFRKCPVTGHVFAPLAISSIYRSLLLFRDNGGSEMAVMIPGIDAALRELARHDQETFEVEHRKIVCAVESLNWEHMVKRLYWSHEQWIWLFDRTYFNTANHEDELENVFMIPESATVHAREDVHSLELRDNSNMGTIKSRHWTQRLVIIIFIAVSLAFFGLPDASLYKFQAPNTQQRNSGDSRHGVMQINGQQGMWSSGIAAGDDGTSSHFHTSETNDQIFSRPIRLDTFTWPLNQAMHYSFNPWQRFFEDPVVINRLAHFKNLKATLCVQVLINGNPFYYGKGLMSYVPLPNMDEISRDRPEQLADVIEATQRPHVFIDPCLSEGGELELPFVWPKACLDIPSREWRKLGRIFLRSVNPLRHSNGGVDPLRITVFAYAKSIELSTPTSQVPVFMEPQGKDEYGVVSLPATALASAAMALSHVPVIGKFARATEMVASNVAMISSLFGFSRPRVVPLSNQLVRLFGDTAVTNYPDTSLTLALDVKKEITIDPRVCGVAPNDEMSFASITSKECWIDSFVWSEFDPPDSHLYSVDISPMMGLRDTLGALHMTPAAFIAVPFEFWKGSFDVRIQVACSAYHRGRIRVVYDPDWVRSPGAYNVNYSAIVDITETTEMTFRIGWSQSLDYLRVGDLAQMIDDAPRQGANTALTTKNRNANGRLAIYVVNDLTSPTDADNPVFINVFAKACDDFEVAAPTEINISKYRISKYTPEVNDEDGNDAVETDVGSCTSLFSRGPEPLRTDLVLLPGGTQLLGNKQLAYFQVYSPSTTTYPVQFTLDANAISKFTLGWQGKEQEVALPVGVTTAIFDFAVTPGWNRIPITLACNTTAADITKVKVKAPLSAVPVTLNGDDLLPGAINAFSQEGPAPPLKFVRATDEDQPIILKLPGSIPGTMANLTMTTRSKVVSSDQRVNDDVFPPSAARIFSFVIASDKTIKIQRIDPEGNWDPAIYSLSYFKSVVVPEGADLVEEARSSNAPETEGPDVTMGPVGEPRGLNDIYFGERVSSIRQCLKRFTTCMTIDCPDGTNPNTHTRYVLPIFPKPMTVKLITGGAIASRPNIWVYFTSPYVCMRGGMRMKMVFAKEITNTGPVGVHLMTRLSTEQGRTPEAFRFDEAVGPFPYKNLLFNGSAVDCTRTKPYPEFEMPWYSNYRFTNPRSGARYKPGDFIVDPFVSWEPAGININNYVTLNYATAEDFSLCFFLSTPILAEI